MERGVTWTTSQLTMCSSSWIYPMHSTQFAWTLRERQLPSVFQLPSLLGYVDSAYGDATKLKLGKLEIEPAEDIQQADPLGPLLFCLTIRLLLHNIQPEFASGCLDDIDIGGEVSVVAADVLHLEQDARALGLTLNHNKCEVIGLTPNRMTATWDATGLLFQKSSLGDALLLGSPIQVGAGVD